MFVCKMHHFWATRKSASEAACELHCRHRCGKHETPPHCNPKVPPRKHMAARTRRWCSALVLEKDICSPGGKSGHLECFVLARITLWGKQRSPKRAIVTKSCIAIVPGNDGCRCTGSCWKETDFVVPGNIFFSIVIVRFYMQHHKTGETASENF